jgi:mono/diheme cytochrome c family protein
MWEAMAARNMPVPQPSEQEVADLFAYFYSLRYFEPPGDAGRGKHAFEQKRCVECHPLDENARPVADAPPVSEWPSIADPMVRLEAMWNHAAGMAQEMKERGIRWPRFRPQEMADLWVFLRTRPNEMADEPRGSFGEIAEGEDVFAVQRCHECHTLGERAPRKIDLKAIPDAKRNFAAFAAAMWNHQPRLAERAALEGDAVRRFETNEMAHLVAYLREQQLFWPAGDADQGAETFRDKSCSRCHAEGSAQAPRLHGSLTPYTPERVASALWRHGPAMLRRMQDQDIPWRRLTGAQLADLIAYINTL